MPELTQDRVKELFDYDPESGVVTRKITTGKRAIKGVVVGSLCSQGYLVVRIDYKQYKLHRIIWLWMTGRWPDPEVDHENQIRDDNKWKNLRRATRLQNGRNQKLPKRNQSGVCGVSWHKSCRKWLARITVNGKSVYLGTFALLEDARSAREHAEEKYNFHPNHGKIQ